MCANRLSLALLVSFMGKVAAFGPLSTSSSSKIPQPEQHQRLQTSVDDRRSFLSTIIEGTTTAAAIATATNIPLVANAEDEPLLTPFKDPNVGFQINVPSGWKKSIQTLPDRRQLVLFLNDNYEEESNQKGLEDVLFVAYTPVRDDFTSLASFGSVEQVGQATILPKGQLAGQDTDNKMIFSESKKNAYYFDYTSKSPDQPKRHFRTIFTMIQGATGGAGSVLVTITAQTLESRYDENMKSMFDQIIDSYRKL